MRDQLDDEWVRREAERHWKAGGRSGELHWKEVRERRIVLCREGGQGILRRIEVADWMMAGRRRDR